MQPLLQPLTETISVSRRLYEPLARLGLHRVIDLLNHFPRGYSQRTSIRDLKPGMHASIVAKVLGAANKATKKKRMKLTEITLDDGTGVLKAVFFNQPWLVSKFAPGTALRLTGPVEHEYGSWSMKPYGWEFADPKGEEDKGLVSEYPLVEGIASEDITGLLNLALPRFAALIPDFLPPELGARLRLMPPEKAYKAAHAPENKKQLDAALLSLKYREFFLLQVGLKLSRREEMKDAALQIAVDDDLRSRALKYFPFEMTGAQKRVCGQMEGDLTRAGRMQRLLQGDVGSGKTAVALFASLLMVGNGFQCAWLAPTEILARQHFANVSRYLKGTKVRIELLIGGMKKSERSAMLGDLQFGRVHILIGTHALLEPDVKFSKLGLCVIDEQHKFGVNQRAALREKGNRPHLLAMSATPIPRTLSMTLYGGLDVSIIDELPPGRKPVRTEWVHRSREAAAFEKIRREVAAGGRAYFIYPLVQETETVDAKSAIEFAERLKNEHFPEFRVGLVHGQMPGDEKDKIMEAFRRGDIDVLAATVVVEVGVDVPEANVMVVENAERFGLAQLHQLRGRIGRGQRQSFLYLFGDPRTEPAIKRLNVLCQTNDGFKIAEEDLKMRGFGDFAGTRQSGVPKLHAGDFEKDLDALVQARKDAANFADKIDEQAIRDNLELHFGKEFRLLGA